MYEIFKEHILYYHAHVAASIALTKNMIYLENLMTCSVFKIFLLCIVLSDFQQVSK